MSKSNRFSWHSLDLDGSHCPGEKACIASYSWESWEEEPGSFILSFSLFPSLQFHSKWELMSSQVILFSLFLLMSTLWQKPRSQHVRCWWIAVIILFRLRGFTQNAQRKFTLDQLCDCVGWTCLCTRARHNSNLLCQYTLCVFFLLSLHVLQSEGNFMCSQEVQNSFGLLKTLHFTEHLNSTLLGLQDFRLMLGLQLRNELEWCGSQPTTFSNWVTHFVESAAYPLLHTWAQRCPWLAVQSPMLRLYI